LDGIGLEIDTASELSGLDGIFSTYLGDTHMQGGTIAKAGSKLPASSISTSTESSSNLIVIIKLSGEIKDAQAVAEAATLVSGGTELKPVVAWASPQYLKLLFDAPDKSAQCAFMGTSGSAIKLMTT
jgi:hypothetical protein